MLGAGWNGILEWNTGSWVVVWRSDDKVSFVQFGYFYSLDQCSYFMILMLRSPTTK